MRFSHKIALLLCLLTITVNSQEKLKGNKDVITQNRDISDFNRIEVIDDLDVYLTYNDVQSVKVETDSNLQDAVLTQVSNGLLSIKLNDKIVRKKELAVHIHVNKQLKEINSYNKSKITSKTSLAIDTLTVNTFDNSDVNLKLSSNIVHLNSNKSSDLNLEISSKSIIVNALESSDIKGNFASTEAFFTLLDKSSMDIEGSASTFEIETLGNTSFKGKDFKADNVLVNATNDSKTYINAKKNIDIRAKNSAEVYLYSNPKITLTEFFDKASLFKK